MIKETYHLTSTKACILFLSLLDLRMQSNGHLIEVPPFMCYGLAMGSWQHFSPLCVSGGVFVADVKMEEIIRDQCSHKSYKDSLNSPLYFHIHRSSHGV